MKWVYILISILFAACSEPTYESRELPTKYPESATMGSATDATEEIYKR